MPFQTVVFGRRRLYQRCPPPPFPILDMSMSDIVGSDMCCTCISSHERLAAAACTDYLSLYNACTVSHISPKLLFFGQYIFLISYCRFDYLRTISQKPSGQNLEAFLRRSIEDSNARVLQGYSYSCKGSPSVMPHLVSRVLNLPPPLSLTSQSPNVAM